MHRLISLACVLLAVTPKAGAANASRTYRQFCAEMDFANKIFAEGVGGKQKLEDCLFKPSKSVKRCVGMLGVGRGIIKYVRKNSKYFRISGDALSGFVLQLGDKRLEEVGSDSRYGKLIRLRFKIQELVHQMGSHKKSDDAADATPAKLIKVQKRYVDLLDEQLEKERDKHIQDCLMRELDIYSKLVTSTD